MSTFATPDLRQWYRAAVQDEAAARAFWERLASYRGQDVRTLGYRAAARCLMARATWNPFLKLSYVQEAMSLFRAALRPEPDHLEVRFLRFSIQHNLPAFLNESQELAADRQALLDLLPHYRRWDLSEEEVAAFLGFFETSGRFSPAELAAARAAITPQA